MADIDLNSPEAKQIVADFLALGGDKAKQTEAFHDQEKNLVLGRIFAPVHFPKPQPTAN